MRFSDVVSFDESHAFDWREMLVITKKYVLEYEEKLQGETSGRLHYFTPYEVGESPEEIEVARVKLVRAMKDPNPSVRIGAEKSLEKIDATLDEEKVGRSE